MDTINGNLNQVENLEGQLEQDLELTGELSPIDNKLTGELTDENYNLIGSLSQVELSMNGVLSIPPEVPVENYRGNYTVIPKPFKIEVLKTAGLKMMDDVTVEKIPYYETGNESGYTVYIGGE